MHQFCHCPLPCRWLYEGVSREKAEELLLLPGNHSGAFLIRESQTRRGEHGLQCWGWEATGRVEWGTGRILGMDWDRTRQKHPAALMHTGQSWAPENTPEPVQAPAKAHPCAPSSA